MTKIKILQTTICGGETVLVDEVVDASDSDARMLIKLGKAEVYTPPKRRARRAPTNRQVKSESLESR